MTRNDLPQLSDNLWRAAADQLRQLGWLSEYGDVKFYVKTIHRTYEEEIFEQLSSLSDVSIDRLNYIESNVSGANGWAIYDTDAFDDVEARRKLELEIRSANFP